MRPVQPPDERHQTPVMLPVTSSHRDLEPLEDPIEVFLTEVPALTSERSETFRAKKRG